jgi:hypothetical protein
MCDSDSFHDESSFKRHLKFHCFHTKLKQIGLNILENLRNNPNKRSHTLNGIMPKCNLDEHSQNCIPELPYKFECSWFMCTYSTDNPELFYRHIKSVHVDNFLSKRENKKCMWKECQKMLTSKSRLVEHIRHHSQEKIVACPTCGALFASYSKLIDHCTRSMDITGMVWLYANNILSTKIAEYLIYHTTNKFFSFFLETQFQCSYCNKKFATNSMLKDHIRKHGKI